jgi:hypothetical protein
LEIVDSREYDTLLTTAWVLGGVGLGAVIVSYVAAPSRRPGTISSATPRLQVAAGVGVPGIGPAALGVSGHF